MVNLILLFLIFNLSVVTTVIPATTSPAPIPQTIPSASFKQPPLELKDNNVMNKDAKVPRPFSLRKSLVPAPKKQPAPWVDITDPEKQFCVHCRRKQSVEMSKIRNFKENKLAENVAIISSQENNNPEIVPVKVPAKPKKKAVIFMSIGGGGHLSVSKALKDYLDNYEITIVNFFEEVMSPVDTIRHLTFGKVSGEDIYNFCLQNRFISIVNGFTKFGAWSLKQKSTSIEPLIEDFIIKHKPDLIISVIPVVNFIILPAAKKFDIPFLIVTNDLDTSNYINGITKIDYDKFYYTVAFNDKDVYSKFIAARIPKSQVAVTGFPLRPEFYDKNKNKTLIKKDFQVPLNKKVVMILMGGAGSFVCYRYVQALARLKKPMHVLACIGRDERLRDAINGIVLPPHLSLSIVGFTNRISDLMAISDLLITKAGPNSICEAIASGLPILIDQTTRNIWWEVLNVDFVKKNRIGDVVTRFKEIDEKVTKCLEDIQYINSVKARMAKIQAGIDFRQRIRCLVDRIVA